MFLWSTYNFFVGSLNRENTFQSELEATGGQSCENMSHIWSADLGSISYVKGPVNMTNRHLHLKGYIIPGIRIIPDLRIESSVLVWSLNLNVKCNLASLFS